MSRIKKRLWMGTSVAVTLAVVVGVVYAAIDVHVDGVRIYTQGIAAGDSSIAVPGQGVMRLGDMSGEDDGGKIVFGEAAGSAAVGRLGWVQQPRPVRRFDPVLLESLRSPRQQGQANRCGKLASQS